jgi:hypothetical protein
MTSDANYFRQANRQLYEFMQQNPAFTKELEAQFPGVTAHTTLGPRGGISEASPPGLAWHHDPITGAKFEVEVMPTDVFFFWRNL